jgi:hypothetical protein
MNTRTKEVDRERLSEKVDKLTEENRRCFLGVLEALTFAQDTIVPGFLKENGPVNMSKQIQNSVEGALQ